MEIWVPDYYERFACLAGKCRHSCCKGWEVDIDPASYRKYLSFPGETGKLLRQNIQNGEESACFRLTEDECCPFLRKDGLCELICREGEDILCDICRYHPRYRSFFSDHVETGLGMCCEEAARIILTHPDKTGWILWNTDDGEEALPPSEEEQLLLSVRQTMISLAQDRSRPFQERFSLLCDYAELPGPFDGAGFAAFLLTLERMDEAWAGQLNALLSSPLPNENELDSLPDLPSEQLSVYLFSRLLPDALEDQDLSGRIHLCLMLLHLIQSLWALETRRSGTLSEEAAIEICRLYSSEIEYSDENIGLILDWLDQASISR